MNMSPVTNSPQNALAADDLLVRKDIFVRATPQRAFDVFTSEMKL